VAVSVRMGSTLWLRRRAPRRRQARRAVQFLVLLMGTTPFAQPQIHRPQLDLLFERDDLVVFQRDAHESVFLT